MARNKKKGLSTKPKAKGGKITKKSNLKKDRRPKSDKKALASKPPDKKQQQLQEWVDQGSNQSPKKKRKEQTGSLRERMLDRLQGAHFRFLNEQLYTSEGNTSNKMFKKNPEAFKAYHQGFQHQVQHWEVNPLDMIITNLKKKSEALVIADFGCGDARLAQSLPNKVHSFDLVALNKYVTACDMAHTPLANESVDIAVFCLSLMGTNLSDFILEANRVLKPGGVLKIAEVESRFDGEKGLGLFIYNVTKYGFKLTSKNLEKTYFYFVDLKKTESVTRRKGLPMLTLKPCVYKKR